MTNGPEMKKTGICGVSRFTSPIATLTITANTMNGLATAQGDDESRRQIVRRHAQRRLRDSAGSPTGMTE